MLAQKIPKTSLVEGVPELQERQAGEENGRLGRDGKKPSPRESGLYFRNMLDNLPGLIAAHDPEDNVIYYNRAAIEFLGGRELTDVLEVSWQTLLHPDDRQGFLDRRAAAIKQHLPYQDECRVKDGSGHYRWMLISAAPQFIDQEFQGYVTSNTDITKRKEMENALEESETRFRSMAEITPIHICVRDASDKTLYFNKASRDFLGMEPPQPGDTEDWFPPDDFWVHPDDLNETLRRRDKGWETHSAFTTECRVKNGRGEYRWLLMASVPRFAGGIFQGYINFGTDVTPLKEADAAVRESELRFRTMADASPNLIAVHDPEDNVIYYNRTAIDFLGGTELKEVIGMPWKTILHPDDRDDFLNRRAAAMRQRLPYQDECRIKDSQDHYRWILISSAPRFVHDEFQGYITSGVDITERKKAESALEESETRFRDMAEITPIHICISDALNNITYYNKALRDFLGADAGSWPQLRNPDDLIHPDDREETLNRRMAGLKDYSSFTSECRVKNSRGEYRWLLLFSVPRFAGETFQGYMTFGTDVTPLKEAESALKESGRRFKMVADTVPAMIYLHDKDERIEFANRGLLDYAGLKPEEAVGVQVGSEAWSHFIHSDDISRFWDDYQDKVRRRAPYQYELRIKSWDGTYQWTTLSGVPRYDQAGRFAGYTGVYADISKLKESERQNNELREGLEKKVIERTAELEAVNKELESFSYSISHDLRAPLRGIDGMSLAVLEDYRDRLDDKGRKYLEILRKEAQHMGELITEMLNLSRLTRGELHWETVNLSETVAEIAGNLKWQEPERHVTFTIKPDVVVPGDAHLLRAVLENLLGNAWKFTSGHPAASIEFGVEEQDGQIVYFVKDDGAGFDMAYANKLFSAFQRLHTASEFPGSGIGLATVQRIIHRHGGRVWARGEVEKGAQIFFTLGKTHEHITEH